MTVKETKPGQIGTAHYYDLSDEERDRVKSILEELRIIFEAESVGFEAGEATISPTRDYTIRIFEGKTIGHIWGR